jgi:hypothetical protein
MRKTLGFGLPKNGDCPFRGNSGSLWQDYEPRSLPAPPSGLVAYGLMGATDASSRNAGSLPILAMSNDTSHHSNVKASVPG